jgi:hypothetical protein
MASISFNDGSSATLENGAPEPFDRFSGWTPDIDAVGPTDAALGTGSTFHWAFRNDYLASLELPLLKASTLAVALRLKRHLLNGGTCTVTTGDSSSNVYTCRLAPGSVPEIDYVDRQLVEYTFKARLKNVAASPLICLY